MRRHETEQLAEALADVIWELGARGLDGVCCSDLSLVEFHALRRLQGAGQLAMQELGLDAGLTKSGATRLVDRLEQRGFLQRERSAADGRICCVVVTPAGAAALREARRSFAARLGSAVAELDLPAQEQLLGALPRLAAAVRAAAAGTCCGPTC